MDTNKLVMDIEKLRNRAREMSNEINSITERSEMRFYIDQDHHAMHPVLIGNSTFMVKREELLPIIDAVMLRDAVVLNNYENMLKRALEALDDSSGPT